MPGLRRCAKLFMKENIILQGGASVKRIPLKKVRQIALLLCILGLVVILAGAGLRLIPLILLGCLVLVGEIVFLTLFWRCPHCGGFLDRGCGLYCPHCGHTVEG